MTSHPSLLSAAPGSPREIDTVHRDLNARISEPDNFCPQPHQDGITGPTIARPSPFLRAALAVDALPAPIRARALVSAGHALARPHVTLDGVAAYRWLAERLGAPPAPASWLQMPNGRWAVLAGDVDGVGWVAFVSADQWAGATS